ncbi:uncharacterized protein I206_103307 [Kwoniella pini CBS 10737]|uniref:Impact N-terminal domain-containing protein n=1 Tax=Kwoniella pini CBS 10737 TaxID=1296096 RepID=A0A1B9I9V0_9TREE|nr:uncharacterized protein I206_01687 [Kwoniella pini CBS 10737]OCF52398.1 hypothetical protein I206_01687 [Kwoniella pini CBS 10737]
MTTTNLKRPSSPVEDNQVESSTKKIRSSSPSSQLPCDSSTINSNSEVATDSNSKKISIHEWLHPNDEQINQTIITHSPLLHESSSTFITFTLSFLPFSNQIKQISTLEKECKRIIRELNVINLINELIFSQDNQNQGAFEKKNLIILTKNGKEKIREPDHRIWACRTLILRQGKDGTKGEDDYQLHEASFDDNEKYGGQTILRALRENKGIDVLSVCCRWYGGDMIGPIRFQHITTTVITSLKSTLKLMNLRDLRINIESLDEEIIHLRSKLSSISENFTSSQSQSTIQNGKGKYDEIDDEKKLERLVIAREKTKDALEKKLANQGT